ncbi:MAG: glycoside hydrolase family 5 protein [Bacteroidales bacterium]|nr:glycoside hydrolase family 5 protein [Bacteroidales bacterium]
MRKIIGFIIFCLCVLSACKNNEPYTLKRGINIAHWLSQSAVRGEKRDAYFTEKDVKYIASLGFDHIRIPIDEEQMFTEQGEKEPEAFALLHRAIKQSIDNNLRVLVDLHILRSHHFNAAEKPLFTQESAQEAFYECWRKLSAELSVYPVGMVAYELMNEPVADNPDDWNKIASRCYEVVRELEPERIIVIGSNRWQSFNTVKDLKVPTGDPNIIISFHYYNPFLLTHYEASWTGQKNYHGPVHYPGQLLTEEELEANCPEELKASIAGNTKQHYDKDTFRKNFKDAVEVAASYGLPVYCGEYGCLSSAPIDDRMRWHRDMEEVFEEMGIARALWCYREGKIGFGILKNEEPDTALIEALQLPKKD